MNTDVIKLIFCYKNEFENLEQLLNGFKAYYRFLPVHFDSLDDILKFMVFLQFELPATIFQVTGVPGCVECDHQRGGVWTSVFGRDDMTVETVFEFLRSTDQLCQHELVQNIFVREDIVHILVKRNE